MRVQSVSETEGGAVIDWKQSDRPCRFCKTVGQQRSRAWESNDGAYMDERFECLACGKIWWAEGVDSWLAVGRFTPLGEGARRAGPRWMATARPLMAIAYACHLIGFGALKEVVRRIGH